MMFAMSACIERCWPNVRKEILMAKRKMIVELRRAGEIAGGRTTAWVRQHRPYFVLKGGNGEVMMHSEHFTRTTSCTRAAKKVAAALGTRVRGSWR